MQPVPPTATRTIYTIEIALGSVLDLSDPSVLGELGVSAVELADPSMRACRTVGGAVAWLEHDGLLVPSARSAATNLVIFATNQVSDSLFEVVSADDITDARS